MLRCLARYANRALGIVAAPGDVVDYAPELEAHLLADAPGSWERLPERVVNRDRMARRAPVRKGASRGDQE